MRRFLAFPCSAALLFAACADDVSSLDSEDEASTGSETMPSSTTTSSTTTSSTDPATATSGTTTSGATVDPTTSVASTTDDTGDSSSSGEPTLCGDGRVDADEECDDGNTEDGDQCSAECTTPFEIVWTVSHNGEASNVDTANGIVIDPAGNIFVGGRVTTIATEEDGWIAMYQPDGTLIWEATIDGGAGLDDRANSLALHPSGDLIVVGHTDVTPEDIDAWVFRLAADTHTVVWQQTHDGPGGGTPPENFDQASAVAVDSAGDFVVAGGERGVENRQNVWIRKYDADGGTLWTDTYNGSQSERDFAYDVVAEAGDSFVVLAYTQEDRGGPAWLRRYASDGSPGTAYQPPFHFTGVGLDATGNVFAAGSRSTASGGQVAAARYDEIFGEVWLQENQLIRGGSHANAIAVDPGGATFLVGFTPVIGEQDNIWIGALDPDGAPLWSDSYNNEEASLGDFAEAAAVGPDGELVVVGFETVLGQQTNGWIRKYRSL